MLRCDFNQCDSFFLSALPWSLPPPSPKCSRDSSTQVSYADFSSEPFVDVESHADESSCQGCSAKNALVRSQAHAIDQLTSDKLILTEKNLELEQQMASMELELTKYANLTESLQSRFTVADNVDAQHTSRGS
jgi:hypothetical protein